MQSSIPATFEIIPTIKSAWHKTYGVKSAIWGGFSLVTIFAFGIGFVIFSGFLFLFFHLFPPVVFSLFPLAQFFSKLLQYLTQMGALYMGIQRAKEVPIHYQMAYTSFKPNILLRLIGLWIILIAVVMPVITVTHLTMISKSPFLALCSILMILLTAYVVIKLILSAAFILDKQCDPITAIKASIEATKGNVLKLIGIYVLMAVILFLCAIPLGIGLIWGFPFAVICHGLIYQNLLPNATGIEPVKPL